MTKTERKPIFLVSDTPTLYSTAEAEFSMLNGTFTSTRMKNVDALHDSFKAAFPDAKVLEISSASRVRLGKNASAMNLMKSVASGESYPVESIYQASKVFENGGPYTDLLTLPPKMAKRDERLKASGSIIGFCHEGIDYPCNPPSVFYDFIYINALLENPAIAEQLVEYDAFTDIIFSPSKGIACQARSAAIFVSLSRQGLLDRVKDYKAFSDLF